MSGTELFPPDREPVDLDDLLERVLEAIVRQPKVVGVEVRLHNGDGRLIKVAEATPGPAEGAEGPRIIVESWLLGSPVRETRRRVFRPELTADVFLPLVESRELLGCVHLRLRPFSRPTPEELRWYGKLARQLAGRIRIVLLRERLSTLEEEHRRLLADNVDLMHKITSMSKELYAVTAISTKINQSMDLDKSISKSAAKLTDLFHAAVARICVRDPDREGWQEHRMAPQTGAVDEGTEALIDDLVREVLDERKPIVLDPPGGAEAPAQPDARPCLVGVPLQSGDRSVGALVLAGSDKTEFTQDNLRLLSGVANIMGMAVENMNLYKRSQRNQRNAAFLAHAITTFSRTLHLKDTLESVVRKAAEFAGPGGQVFLFSETKIPLLHGSHRGGDGERATAVSAPARLRPSAINRIVRAVLSHSGYGSILFETVDEDRAPADVRAYLRELGIGCLVAIPLHARTSVVGLLLVGRAKHLSPFDTHDLSLLEALGNAASVAIDNARTYSSTLDLSDSKDLEITRKDDRIHLLHERQQYRIEAMDDLVFWVDTDLRYVFGNRTTADLFGYPREELCAGQLWVADGIAEEDRGRVLQSFARILTRERDVERDVTYRHIARNGREHVVSVTLYPLMDLSGQIIGVEALGRDVTDEKRLEAELKKAKELAVLGEFSSAVAHQIRNPLGNILMGTKLLEKTLGLGGGRREEDPPVITIDKRTIRNIFSDLSDGVNNLNAVVTELLAYTRTMEIRPSVQDIETLVMDSLAPFSQQLQERGIRVIRLFEPGLPLIEVDAILMANVLQNVIHNALQAMAEPGLLGLTASLLDGCADHIVLSVSDTGVGIPKADLDKVFRPFYTTKDAGVGLGLSLAHRVVEAHRGAIWACLNPCPHLAEISQPEAAGAPWRHRRGTTVHVRLPCRRGAESP
ncbi:MAG: hypothetical protein Kow0092_22380 [Deferrisomatales bacterium]